MHLPSLRLIGVVFLAALSASNSTTIAAEGTRTTVVLPTWTSVPNAAALNFDLRSERLSRPGLSDRTWLSARAFARLPAALAEDSAMRTAWNATIAQARRMLADGRWTSIKPDETGRYTYVVRTVLARFALLYAATGEEHLGEMLHTLMLDTARRPLAFWVHAELRPFSESKPLAGLETAELARAVSLALVWAPELFSSEERNEIETALRNKALVPSFNWLEKPRPNNWLATIASGAMVTAQALRDPDAIARATTSLESWLKLVEDDGSYGEPAGYLQFALTQFFTGWWTLGFDAGRERLQSWPLRKALPWFAYHFIAHRDPATGETLGWKVNFGDDDFTESPDPFVFESLALAYRDGLGTWLSQHLSPPKETLPFNLFLLRLETGANALPAPRSPAEAKIPLDGVFSGGLAFFRSGWSFDHDVVAVLRGGGRNRTAFTHDRPNRNALALFVDGDYLIAAPGRASYRSPLRSTWDMQTSSHSTITLDGAGQSNEATATFSPLLSEKNGAYLESDATASYAGANRVLRQAWFLRESGIVVLRDTVEPKAPAAVAATLLLANYDGQSQLAPLGPHAWRLQRPTTTLVVSVSADKPVTFSNKPGRMHTGYSYYPGDPAEGKPGSAFQVSWTSEKTAAPLHFWTLLVPRAQGLTGVEFTPEEKLPAGAAAGWTLVTSRGENHVVVRNLPRIDAVTLEPNTLAP